MTITNAIKTSLVLPFLAAFTLLTIGASASAQDKYASIVINTETDEVLHARFADERRFPASLTKVMTLYMLFDAIEAGDIKLSDRLTVSAAADRQPASDLGVKNGSTIKVEDAIYALVTKSANDVAVVVAEHIGGTEERFSALMTVKARSLGLASTSFYNASGLPDERQVTTASDMAKLAEALLENHGDSYHYFSNPKFSWGRRTYRNHNKLLGKVDGVDGIKTGYTRASGYNLMASAERHGTRIIVIMLGGNSSKSRNSHVTALIEAAYKAIAPEPILPAAATGPQIAFAPSTGAAVSRVIYTGADIGTSPDEAVVAAEGAAEADLEATTETDSKTTIETVASETVLTTKIQTAGK